MMWYRVMSAAIAAVAADTGIIAVYGSSIRLLGTGQHRVPLLEYSLVADIETELWAPMTLQWDQFTKSLDALAASELRLRTLFHTDLPQTIGGMQMFLEYLGGETLAQPDRDGYHGRAIRFRYTPLRALYQQPVP